MPVRSLRDGTIKIADNAGTGGANVITVAVEEGDLSFTERHPANIVLDRGVIDHARKANDEPVELSFSIRFQYFLGGGVINPYEALTKTSGAAAWTSDLANTDVYAVVIEFTIDDPAGGADEVLTFANFIPEEISFTEGDPHDSLSVSGRAVITAPTIA